ncbi:MAG: site-specific integrase [Clostridia bacterium]|nr:site-specific integrase [Clostridia bacterium]
MSVRQRGNSYQVIYRCPGESSPRTETFKSKEEAQLRELQIKLAKKNGTFEPPVRVAKGEIKQIKDVTVKELLGEYVEIYGLKKWGNSYYTANTGLIDNYINPHIGDRYVKSLSVKDMDAYYTKLLDCPAVVTSGHKPTGAKITANTISRIHKVLKCAFGRAVVWGYTTINPTIGATLPKDNPKARAVWSDAEALEAIKVCDNPILKLCLYLALGCSMRLGEILGLQWDNVYLDDNEPYLKIDKELQRCSNKSIEALEKVNRSTIITKFPVIMPKKATTTVVLKAPKTQSSNRIVYLPKSVIDELIKAKETQKENMALLANEYHDYNLVVAKVNGMPYELRTIDKMFYKLIEEKSLRPVVFHSLRHSSTSLKLKLSKGNIKAVQGDTGHAEARMVTDTYAHSFDDDRKLIAKEMDSGFFAKVDDTSENTNIDSSTLAKLKLLVKQHPELLDELLE